MVTLADRIYEFNKKYIRRTQEHPIENKTVEDTFGDPAEYISNRSKYSGTISPEKRRELALQSDLFMKGIIKKNSDTFRAWFTFKQFDGIKIPKEDIDLIQAFEQRTQIKKKFKIAGMCADIYGDGFLLIKYAENDNGEFKLEHAPPKGAEPLDIILLNAENIIAYETKEKNKLDEQFYYHYFNPKKSEDKYIHPDRIVHIKTLELPFDFFGISKVDILRNILISSADIDIATGEILKWFSHGTQVLTKTGMQKNERDKALALMKEHPNYFAFSEKYNLDVKNPSAINPTPFYDHISEAISAALIIPRQVLLGIEIGRVTGAEIGFADYYRDIKDNQELAYTPHILRIYDLLAESHGRDFSKYYIEWEITYIDEMAEAELEGKRAAAVCNLRSATPPIISIQEARRMLNEGLIELDPDEEPEAKPIIAPAMPPQKGPNPPQGPQPPQDSKTSSSDVKQVTRSLTAEEKEMIAALEKLVKDKAEKERKLGEEILKEQEKL